MKLLLDTHALIWFIAGDARLSSLARRLIEPVANEVWASVASLGEIAIKVSIGKLSLTQPFEVLVPAQLEANTIGILPIQSSHLVALSKLPLHHRDSFDRLIVAQAITEKFDLVSADLLLDAYPIVRQW